MDSSPRELDEANRRQMQLEIEMTGLKKEKDPSSRERLEKLSKELAEIKEKTSKLRLRWDSEKQKIAGLQGLRQKLEQAKYELEKAQRNYDLNSAAQLQHGAIPQLERQLAEAEKALKAGNGERLLKEEVDEEDIAGIVARWTNIPLRKLVEGEKEKVLSLAAHLHERVIGQSEAVDAVADAVLRGRAGLKDPQRPIGSFIFLGPTGVGKTELARSLAFNLFDDEHAMIRIDMSEYMEKHTVSRLIGAPPGYVGYDEGGQLTEAVRRKPYSVILFDEIEKAHPDVFNILLQILDDGRVTDSHGHVVNFKNTIIIMTSNIGSQHIVESTGKAYEDIRKMVLSELKNHFRPEFLNRVDEIVVFHGLSQDDLVSIVDIQLQRFAHLLTARNIEFSIDKKAKAVLATTGYDPVYGARPLKRAIQKELETPVSRMLVSGELADGQKLKVTADGEKLKFLVQ
jgi:ATP-dependent Clp protease ATP-binding subunit ClpB